MGIGEIFNQAGKTLFSRFGKTLITFLAYFVITSVLFFVCSLVSKIPVISIIASIAVYVIVVPLQFGFMKQFISLFYGEEVKAFDFINLGCKNLGIVWKVTLRLFVKYLGVIVLLALSVILGLWFEILGTIGMFITYIWIIVLAFKYGFVYNELAHDENRTAKEVIDITAQNMEGNKGKLFVITLIVFAITFVISLLTTIPLLGLLLSFGMVICYVPFLQYVIIAFYEDVRNRKMPNVTIMNENHIEPQDPIQM